MWNLFDHVGKTIGVAALGPCGATEMEAVIAPAARRADLRHEPDPTRDAERAPPAAEAFVSPVCWIIAARRPAAALARFAATAATDWPPGVYFGTGALVGAEGALRVGIVDASELPRDRSTLLVRFMAAGPLLPEATAELAALEEGAHERAVAEQILVDLEHVLGSKAGTTPEEEEFVMSMQGTWKDAASRSRSNSPEKAAGSPSSRSPRRGCSAPASLPCPMASASACDPLWGS